METTVLTAFSRDEIKSLLREVLMEVLGEGTVKVPGASPTGPMNITEAAEFLRLKITTLYEKTSKHLIPYIKKGGKLYFIREELEAWLLGGKVKTNDELEGEAETRLYYQKRNLKNK